MKLLSLEIENFGSLHQQKFEFANDFQLVYGPNEAGKSTLLQLLRETFFGFRNSNPYQFASHSGEMAATAVCELRDGRVARFRRRKGLKNTVVGKFDGSGTAFDAAALEALLNPASPKLYEHLFAFSLAELSQGEKSLREANMSDALYGSAWGGISGVVRFKERLQSESKDLLGATTRSSAAINTLLIQVRRKRDELRDSAVRPAAHQQARERLESQERHRAEVRELMQTLQLKQSHLDRLHRALPLYLRLCEQQHALEQIGPPVNFPRDGLGDFGRLKQRLEEIIDDIVTLDEEQHQVVSRLTQLHPDPKLSAQKANLVRLREQIEKVRDIRRDLPQRSAEAEVIRNTVLGKLRSLNPGWSFQHLDQFSSSLVQRNRIDGMRAEIEELGATLAKLRQTRDVIVQDIADLIARGAQLAPPAEVGELEPLVEQIGEWKANDDRLRDLSDQSHVLLAREKLLRDRLSAPLPHAMSDPAALPVPLEATVAEFRGRFDNAEADLKQARARCMELKEAIARLQEQQAALAGHEELPARSQLSQTRRHRDEGWRLVRRVYVEKDGTPELAADWLKGADLDLPDAFERAQAEADRVADDRLAKAERAAKLDQLVEETARREVEFEKGKARLAEHENGYRELEMAWSDLWKRSGIAPLSPHAMSDWLRLHAELLELLQQRVRIEIPQQTLVARAREFESKLRSALGDTNMASLEALAHRATETVRLAREEATKRETLATELAGKRRALEDTDRKIRVAEADRANWELRWRPMIDEFGFPSDWDVHNAAKILDGLNLARLEFQQVESLESRVCDMHADLDAFVVAARRCVQELAQDLSELPPEEAIVELCRRLDRADADAQAQSELTRRLNEIGQLREEKERQKEACEATRRELFTKSNAANESQFYELAKRSGQRDELVKACDQLKEQLAFARGAEAAESFLGDLQHTQAEQLSRDLDDATEELKRAGRDHEEASQECGNAAQQLKQLEEGQTPLELAAELESLRGELAELVDRWAPRAMALSFVRQSVERFEQENQPELLEKAGELFSLMTEGRYHSLRRRLDETGTLEVDEITGQSKTPNQLSTGTREQLYLAIRLAYLDHFTRTNEPMPVVMDDVLANFDDRRARQTLAVLVEFSRKMQIIFLSCHRSRMDQWRELSPNCGVLELPVFSASPARFTTAGSDELGQEREDSPAPDKTTTAKRRRTRL